MGRISQRVALAALESAGRPWVAKNVTESIAVNRKMVAGSITRALGCDAILGSPRGAIYLMVRLPSATDGPADDMAAIKYLADHHQLVVIPGSPCGAPGCIRVAYANLPTSACEDAAKRLEAGLA